MPWATSVSPESHGGCCFIVTCFVEAGEQEVICQFSTLRKPVASSDNLKVYPTTFAMVGFTLRLSADDMGFFRVEN